MRSTPARPETVFTYAAPTLVYGAGAVRDIGFHLQAARRPLVITDPGVRATGAADLVAGLLDAEVFEGAHVEPTDVSLEQAVAWAVANGPFDALVAVGGGSTIDTAKAVNLLTTNPGTLMDYVNAPIGGGRVPEMALHPLIAVPTTTGTGSESTTICVLDVLDQHVKTGISHARLRPTVAIVDPDLTMTQPPMVTACAGLDILCHALESYTARPYTSFEAKTPAQRVPYCGANPISDVWAQTALRLLAESFVPAVRHGHAEDRAKMALAATLAGMGFGNAGVHVPHANAYPIAGRARDYRPPDYPQDHALIPHGMAVSLTAPASLRLLYDADPARQNRAAALLGGHDLSLTVREMMDAVGMPSGLRAVGFAEHDIDDLVEGAWAQQRLLALAPLEVDRGDLAAVFRESL